LIDALTAALDDEFRIHTFGFDDAGMSACEAS